MKPIHILLMLGTVAVWGFNFVAMRVVLEVFSPEQMAFARSVLTLTILLPWWKPFRRIPWQLVAAALAIGTGSFYFLYQAISRPCWHYFFFMSKSRQGSGWGS